MKFELNSNHYKIIKAESLIKIFNHSMAPSTKPKASSKPSSLKPSNAVLKPSSSPSSSSACDSHWYYSFVFMFLFRALNSVIQILFVAAGEELRCPRRVLPERGDRAFRCLRVCNKLN